MSSTFQVKDDLTLLFPQSFQQENKQDCISPIINHQRVNPFKEFNQKDEYKKYSLRMKNCKMSPSSEEQSFDEEINKKYQEVEGSMNEEEAVEHKMTDNRQTEYKSEVNNQMRQTPSGRKQYGEDDSEEEGQIKFGIQLEKFKLSASSSNKKIAEENLKKVLEREKQMNQGIFYSCAPKSKEQAFHSGGWKVKSEGQQKKLGDLGQKLPSYSKRLFADDSDNEDNSSKKQKSHIQNSNLKNDSKMQLEDLAQTTKRALKWDDSSSDQVQQNLFAQTTIERKTEISSLDQILTQKKQLETAHTSTQFKNVSEFKYKAPKLPVKKEPLLSKGKSVILPYYQNEFQPENQEQIWNLELYRRNSEVELNGGDEKTRVFQDIGENEFTKAINNEKKETSNKNSNNTKRQIVNGQFNKQRNQQCQQQQQEQHFLHQIPEGVHEFYPTKEQSKLPMKPQHKLEQFYDSQHQVLPNNLFSNKPNEEQEGEYNQLMRSIIEDQDFEIIFRKATSGIGNEREQRILSYTSIKQDTRFTKDFKIISVINQSASTSLYKCESSVNGLIYAIKVIQLPTELAQEEKIMKQIQSLAKFSAYGCGLVKYYNAWTEENRLYLVMEHCVQNLTQSRKPSEQQIRQIMRDIAKSLQFLHQNNCSHLGIKPENILLSKKGSYKLADLGLSRIASSTKAVESYYPYIAPELAEHKTHQQDINTQKTDIFSLGAVLYELITDCQLPKFGTEWENIRSGRLNKLMNSYKISGSLKNLIKSMLLRNPQLRPSAADLLSSIPSENVYELELKYAVEENKSLQNKLEELLKQANEMKIKEEFLPKRRGSQ